MIELASGIYYIEGKNRSRFPYCAGLYVKGRRMRVLIDAGMGRENLAPAKKMGVDLVLMTHCHIDHRLTSQELNDIPFGCHLEEEPYLKSKKRFMEGSGLTRGGLDLASLFESVPNIFDISLKCMLRDGEAIELGGLSLIALHTPGHTPGHLSFLIPEHGLLFSGDIDLTAFGPFYGHDFADIDKFIQSIDRLKKIPVQTVATGHAGPFKKNISERFEAYRAIIFQREKKVFESLVGLRTLESYRGQNLIYSNYGQDEFMQWFELVHIEKHLKRLQAQNLVTQNEGRWERLP